MLFRSQAEFLPYKITEIKRSFHEYNFDKFKGGVRVSHVEFHWKMSTSVYGMDITLSDLSTEIRKGNLQGNVAECFSPSANLLLTIMHHGGRDLFRDLKQVLDIAKIVQNKEVDWEKVLSLANRFRVINLVLVGVRLATDLNGIEIPENLKERINAKKIITLSENRKRFLTDISHDQNPYRQGYNRWLFRMQSLRGIFFKIRLTWFIVMLLRSEERRVGKECGSRW